MAEHEHTDDIYTCTKCGAGYNEPKRIRVCASCKGVKTIKLTSALRACAQAHGQLKTSLENFDAEGFAQAKQDLDKAQNELSPPSIN